MITSHSSAVHARHRRPPHREADAGDLALLQALAGGGEHAFWTLWMKHSRRLLATCSREMNGNREDAEDALQETMLRAHRRMPAFAARITCPASWLARMAVNVCRDIQRGRTRDARIAAGFTVLHGEACALPGQTPEAPQCDPLALIARLPERLRGAFVLRVVEHVAYADIAARLGVTCATARKRVQQSRSALRAWRDSDAA